jgi:hypothetical protein
MKSVTGTAALLLSFFFLFSACAFQGTPRHSLRELKNALLAHDAERALKYIDVDSIVDHMVEDALRTREAGAKTDLDLAALTLGRSIISVVQPQANAFIRKAVYAAIESDDQLGYFSQIKRASIWYLRIDQKDDEALITPRGDDKVRFKMERTDKSYWRIKQLILKNPS